MPFHITNIRQPRGNRESTLCIVELSPDTQQQTELFWVDNKTRSASLNSTCEIVTEVRKISTLERLNQTFVFTHIAAKFNICIDVYRSNPRYNNHVSTKRPPLPLQIYEYVPNCGLCYRCHVLRMPPFWECPSILNIHL